MVHWVKKCRLLFNIWRGRICYSLPISTDGNGCVCVRVRMTNENEESTNILSMRSLTIFPLIFENEKMIYRLDKSQCWIFKWYFYDNIFFRWFLPMWWGCERASVVVHVLSIYVCGRSICSQMVLYHSLAIGLASTQHKHSPCWIIILDFTAFFGVCACILSFLPLLHGICDTIASDASIQPLYLLLSATSTIWHLVFVNAERKIIWL